MTMYFQSLFPIACPIGHNGWIEIGYPICIVYSFTDWIDQYFINVYVSYQISNKGIGEYEYYPIEQQAFVCAFEICVLAQMWIFTWSLTHNNEETTMKLN